MTTGPRHSGSRVAVRCCPRRLRVVVGVVAALVISGAAVGWVSLPRHVQVQFSLPQLATLIAVLLALILGIGAMASSYVEAGEDGLVFRNGLRTHRFAWTRVIRVSYGSGDPWASLWVLPEGDGASRFDTDVFHASTGGDGHSHAAGESDGEHPDPKRWMLLGIQRSDRGRAQQAVTDLRRLHATQSRVT